MKIETQKDRSSGSWITIPEAGRPEVIVHRREGASGDDPVTVFWGGTVSLEGAMDFFQRTVGLAGPERPSVLRMVAFTPADPAHFEDAEKLLLPEPARSAAKFVRFEHCVSRRANERNPADEKDADYIVWARLQEKDDKTDDSIGVYVRPSRLHSIIPLLAEFVSAARFSHMSPGQAAGMLEDLDRKLPSLR